ncbi:hypothetical protein [Fictibacillus barbaricus]|uniref:Uncharacterized protein n=1 Tax=Fictibacillus barbaricus TaxID=182136 RepID=A0ABU1TWW2_9BACL|nr:hypothetical protein [Fictibacillus barbaricus]MDR7071704.1 hypothetical protein [Fictibacillus barbaricus]
MAKTKARKLREKLVREGKRNPDSNRSTFSNADIYKMMTSKKTKTKKDKLNQVKHKERLQAADYSGSGNGSYLLAG